MLTPGRLCQNRIEPLNNQLMFRELENWLLVSENTPEITMWGVSQLFLEMLDILTAKHGVLF